tara:strand:+ start:33 stop:263 length:231 start_codon:yes stop_codon:yes gene_type:complete
MKEEHFGATKIKEKCLALLNDLDPEGLVITKHGKPVARVIPYPRTPQQLIGSLRNHLRLHGDIMSTGVDWDANAKS